MFPYQFFYNVRNEALRVAFIHQEERVEENGEMEYYSKLIKADIHGKDQVQKTCTFRLTFSLDKKSV